MGNRPHPHGRRDNDLIRMTDVEFEAECDKAFLDETARDALRRRQDDIEWENSPAQREFEGHDDSCESEFITEAGMYSPCRCNERAEQA